MTDMVASVTLRLRDQMSAGIDEIKREFGSVQATLDKLTVVLGDLQGTLDALRMPPAINQSLRGTIGDASAAAKAVTSIGVAAAANVGPLDAMNAALSRWSGAGGSAFGNVNAGLNEWTGRGGAIDGVNASPTGPLGYGAPGSIPDIGGGFEIPGVPYQIHNPAIPQEFFVPQVPSVPGKQVKEPLGGNGDHPGDGLMDFIGASIMAVAGVDSVKTMAQFNNLNLHSAITERYSGERARQQQRWIGNDLDRLALKYRQSSDELAEAYYYLVTTHMKPALVNALMPMIAKTATAYNSSPMLMGAAAFAMSDSFKIPASEMQASLAAMAWAAKNSHFSIESMGMFLPMLGGMAATIGMTGRGNLDQIMAMVETVRKNVNQPQEAAHDLADLMQALSSIHTAEAFSQNLFKRALKTEKPLLDKYHIQPVDLWKVEQDGKKHGLSPLMAVMEYMHKLVAPMTAVDRSAFINSMFNGQQAGMAIKSMLLHWQTMMKLETSLDKVTPALLATDFNTAIKGSATEVRLFDENLKELSRGFGRAVYGIFSDITNAATAIQLWGSPKMPEKMTPRQRAELLSDGVPAPWNMPSNSNEHTAAVRANTRALQEAAETFRQQLGVGVNPAISHGASSPVGPMLGRP
ncbi:MAG: phage tail tape measure protein [Acidiphilium sp.]